MKSKKIIIIILLIILIVSVFLFKDYLLKTLYPKTYQEVVSLYEEKYHVEENLIFAVIKAESNFDTAMVHVYIIVIFHPLPYSAILVFPQRRKFGYGKAERICKTCINAENVCRVQTGIEYFINKYTVACWHY